LDAYTSVDDLAEKLENSLKAFCHEKYDLDSFGPILKNDYGEHKNSRLEDEHTR
jgi:hypothetical protein